MPALHWPPDVFWRASLAELTAAIDGWNAMNGNAEAEGFSDADREEVQRLMEKYC